MSNQKPSKPKRGMVVNRRHNRTVETGKATRAPLWENVGFGVLRRFGPESKTAYVTRGPRGQFVNVTRGRVVWVKKLLESQKAQAKKLEREILQSLAG